MTLIEWSELLGNFGEFFGAIAVVATLIFLSVQVQHSKRATEANTRSMENAQKYAMAQAYQSRADTLINITHHSPENMAKLVRDDFDPDEPSGIPYDVNKIASLPFAERLRLREYFHCLMLHTDNVTYQQKLGLMPDEVDPDSTMLLFALPFWRELNVTIRPLIQEALDERGISESSGN